MYGCSKYQAGLAPVVTELCQGMIRSAQQAGNQGTPEREAFRPFETHGATREMFQDFVGRMATHGLIERHEDATLHATRKGIAYAIASSEAPATLAAAA